MTKVKNRLAARILPFILSSGLACLSGAQEKPGLSPRHDRWLKEEVVYIISETEKSVFLALESEGDRDLFIEEFWRQRDPMPGTPRNEFRDEHYRRIEFANRTFGRGTPTAGWRTDRGRYYIALGPPFDVERFVSGDIHPAELWYFRGTPAYGLPGIFRLLFFQKYGAGDFKLYNPASNRPSDLVPHSDRLTELDLFTSGGKDGPGGGRPTQIPEKTNWNIEDQQAYKILREVGSDQLAAATVSIRPGSVTSQDFIPSSVMIGAIESIPKRKVAPGYAEDFLKHKATVEVDYSVHHIGNRFAAAVLRDPSGAFFLNYVLVPDALSVDSYENLFSADMKTTVRLADSRGKTVYQQDRDVPLALRKEELKALGDSSFHYYDSLPVVPGRYKFSVLWENTVSREFTSFEGSVFVPAEDELILGSLVATKNISEGAVSAGRRGFQAGPLQLYPSPGNVFSPASKVRLFFQVFGLTPELRASGSFEFGLARGDQPERTTRKNIRDYGDGNDFLEPVTLARLAPGRYALTVSVRDGEDRILLSDGIPLMIAAETLPSPWVFSPKNPAPGDARYDQALGVQLLNLDRVAEASAALARARGKDPASVEIAADYGRALLLQGRAAEAREALWPFADAEPGRFEVQAELAQAAQALGDAQEAIVRYIRALSLRGRVVEILNALGECYFSAGDREKAAKAWRDSLAINPNQEAVKKLLGSLEPDKQGAIK